MRDDTPVLIGAGQFTYRGDPLQSPSPLGLLRTATERAAADAGVSLAALSGLDTVAVVASAIDSGGALSRAPFPKLRNAPAALAKALGASPSYATSTHMGGNTPQQLINALCERIASGESRFALAVGAEFLGSLRKRMAAGSDFAGWEDDGDAPEPERFGDGRPGVTPQEQLHWLNMPVNTYPMFENALRAHQGQTLEAHQRQIGELFSRFTRVAAANPDAWFRKERSADELITVDDQNRMVGFPYPKLLNAIMEVDQSAGVLIASLAAARELGVPEDRWVYLHGCAEAADLWYVLERQNYWSSPAIRLSGKQALDMAGAGIDEIDFIDIYSCFPSAVEIAAIELGLALEDPRGFTVTGGLPYMGGPGNNYAMHSVAVMLQKLRARPGAKGLVTANGWYLTKQAIGIYSTDPVQGQWRREDPHKLQHEIDALPHPPIADAPQGRATIETYTVVHRREGAARGIVIGRDQNGHRFVANTPEDEATLRGLEAVESVGRTGVVGPHPDGQRNLFTPD
ncbi:MAG TPA: acetyl-CoA acetyltransferase [Caulobacteraceae bacterium]|nr:acetyl-CoA acetyltransferase [Caulobacteraceae bacterium]